jgi:serpin B
MKPRFRQSLFAALAAAAPVTAFAACGESFGPITDLPRQLTAAEESLVEADNRFTFKLFREVNAQDASGGNVFISPLSVGMALGMTYNGAAGTTRDAMQQTLELGGMSLQEVNEAYRSLIDLLRNLDPRVEFLLANSIWHDLGWAPLQEFVDLNRQYFDAEVTGLDFSDPASSDVINGWVSDNTKGKIREIVPKPIPPEIVMYLINAIYFKGDWTYQFERDLTRDATFHLTDGSETTVRMMTHDGKVPVRVYFDEDVTVADLPYGGQAYSMTIAMPREAAGIETLVGELDQSRWHGWITALDSTEMRVSLPKFTIEYDVSLNQVLIALGMGPAFSYGVPCDFTNMFASPAGSICISKVKHKTYVDVNEEGTEAAAATSVSMATSAPRSVYVDRPFVFAIRERYSGTILFMGTMLDPSSG